MSWAGVCRRNWATSAAAKPVTTESCCHHAGHPDRILTPIMKYPVLAKIATNLIPFAMGSYATGLQIYVGVQSFVGGNVVRLYVIFAFLICFVGDF